MILREVFRKTVDVLKAASGGIQIQNSSHRASPNLTISFEIIKLYTELG
jgi:hypothetical protein